MKQLRLLLPAFLLAPVLASAQEVAFAGFDDFAARYRAAMPVARHALAASFVRWQKARGGFPIIEPDGAVLVWFGTGRERSVAVGGDFRPRHFYSVYWDERGDPMQPVAEGGAVWFRRVPLEPDASIDYAFRIDGEWKADPLNPRTGSGHQIGVASEIAMPGFAQPAEVVARPGVSKGTVRALEEPWATPKVQIYLPPGYDSARSYPVIYAADGDKWIDHGALPAILDNLIADGVIRPVIAVAIDAAENRSDWYYFNSKYLAYLARVIDWVDGHYATVRSPAGRLHVGTSSGGRAALWAALSRPDLFGNVGLFSANYSAPVGLVAAYLTGEKRPDPRLRVWMSAGSHEPYILDDARAMQAWFTRLRQPLRVVYTHGGHNWATWRSLVKDALRYFYPASDAVAVGPGVVGGQPKP